ncbi:MFS transporter [Streptomyces sp. NRRL B-24484]|uniref:MFS transporter n=1 Tax=Streptomyces sp. NRRL B-24484 TaxID=1463833 RepID=UPI0007C5932C|nr:MFS transporter [Streptomyces sp. NRRL B-24484]
MFTSYRRILALPGALAFTLAGLPARLSMSMTGVSAVVLISERRHSYALAGAVSAAGLVTLAVLLPLLGRLVDRYGQARVAVPAVLAAVAPMAGLLLCLRSGAPDWTLFLCWAACSTAPNVGGMVRARWAHLLRGDEAGQHLANSLEQALDELCFMLGPVLAVLLCRALTPEAGLLTSAALCVAGVLLLSAQRGTEPPLAPASAGTPGADRTNGTDRTAGGRGGLLVLLPMFLATGVVFGSMEVTTIAYTDATGHGSLAGLLLGLVAAGSCVSGLVFGLLRPRRGPVARLLGGVAAMAVLMLLPAAAGLSGAGPAVLAAALFLAGSGTAPTMVSGMTLVQQLVPAGRLNEAMAAAVSAILVGISAGSALGGAVAQRLPGGTGYVVPAAAAATALLIAATGTRRLRATAPTTGTPAAGLAVPVAAGLPD